MRYNYKVVLSSFFEGVLRQVVKHIAKIAPIRYKRTGSQYIIYVDTKDRAELITHIVQQLFCEMLMYKYGVPHRFCELSVSIKEEK
jgi:hypothetical protein